MRLPTIPTRPTSRRAAGRGAVAAAAALALGLSTGCEVTSFIDPSELAGYPRRPLVVNIVDDLGTGYETANQPFSQAQDVRPADLQVREQDYTIGAGDFIQVSITGLTAPGAETQVNRRVSETGQLNLPLLPTTVEARGKTEGELEQTIIDAYSDGQLIRRESAQVAVVVVEPRGRTFSITGSVARPSQYVIVESDFRLLDALVVAGDTTSIIGIDDIFVIRDLDQDAGEDDDNLPDAVPVTPGGTGTGGGTQTDLLQPPPRPGPNQTPPARTPQEAQPTQPPAGVEEPPAGQTRPQFDPLVPGATAPRPGGERFFAVLQEAIRIDASDAGDADDAGDAPAAGRPNRAEGRIITIEGQPQPADGTDAEGRPAAADGRVTPANPAGVGGDVTPPLDTSPVTVEPGTSTRPTYGPGLPAPTGIDEYDDEALDAAPALPPGTFEFDAPEEPTDKRVIRIPLDRLKTGELKYNIVIRPGDLIVVPPPIVGEYYMGGHVARVGVYSLTGRDVTLKQAIISAGMLDPVAIPQRTRIVRRIGTNQEIIARVDLAAIFEGREPDLFLKPDDQVMVGTNFVAPFIAAIRNGFRVTYGFGFLYDQNFSNDDNNN